MALNGKKLDITHVLPSEVECWDTILKSELKYIPKTHTVIIEYVEGMEEISKEKVWHSKENFYGRRCN